MQTKWGFSLSHLSAAIATWMVSYGSSAVIIYQAAMAFGATPLQITSWFTMMALLCGILTLLMSLYYRMPIIYAWCTPGAALMVGMTGVSIYQAVAAFMFASFLMLLVASLGWFDRLVKLIPSTLISAMLAGVLLNFGIGVFTAMQTQHILVGLMLFGYFISRLWFPRYAILLMFVVALLYVGSVGLIQTERIQLAPPALTWIMPEWQVQSLISVGIPLFIALLATQNLPGIAVLKSYGYETSPKLLTNASSLGTILTAPLGTFTVNLAAISAAICMEKNVDADAQKRYLATVLLAILYLSSALLGGMVVALFTALPKELLMAFAGIAIFNTLQSNLGVAWQDETTREAALMTLLLTASGLTLFGVGSAFWGLLLGLAIYHLNRYTAKKV